MYLLNLLTFIVWLINENFLDHQANFKIVQFFIGFYNKFIKILECCQNISSPQNFVKEIQNILGYKITRIMALWRLII